MVQNINEQDKKLLAVVQELSEMLTSYKYEESWEKVGELNALLKNKEPYTLPTYMLDMLEQHIKSYYYQNKQVNQAHKAMSAIGHKLADFTK